MDRGERLRSARSAAKQFAPGRDGDGKQHASSSKVSAMSRMPSPRLSMTVSPALTGVTDALSSSPRKFRVRLSLQPNTSSTSPASWMMSPSCVLEHRAFGGGDESPQN